MSIEKLYYLECENCRKAEAFPEAGNKKEARDAARSRGWSRSKAGEWNCRMCKPRGRYSWP